MQKLRLVPLVLRWCIGRDTVEQRLGMLDAVLHVFSRRKNGSVSVDEAIASAAESVAAGEETLHMRAAQALKQLLNEVPEAPVLGKALDIVLALAQSAGRTRAAEILAALLPVVAQRLKQAAPKSVRLRRGSTIERAKLAMRMQWLSNDVKHHEPPSNLDSNSR